MAKPDPEYELVLMLDPEMPDERRDQIAVDARKRIEGGAELKQERSWGLRKMAYEIGQRNEADYRFFRFGQGKAVLDDLNHNLKITDGVLRYRIFKVEHDAPVIDPPPPFSLAATSAQRPGGGPRRRDEESAAPAPAQAEAPAPSAESEAPAEQPAQPEPQPVADTGSAPQPEVADEGPAGDESAPEQA